MERSCIAVALSVVLMASGAPAHGAGGQAGEWSPPVDGPIVRGYEPPSRPYGPQHLGIDYGVPPGTQVRAAGDGVVAFAGLVGRSRSVAVEHPGGRRTTYAYLRRVVVHLGGRVEGGHVLGFSGGEGPGHHAEVVHFGYRVHGQPQDPAQLFRPRPPRISLAPLDRPACPSGNPPVPPGPQRNG